MATRTVTIELDQATATILKAKAAIQGLSLDALLRHFAEGVNGTVTPTSESETPQLTPYELAKDLIDSIDSSVPDHNSPPIYSDFGQHLLEEYTEQVEKLNGAPSRNR